jgi:SPOR domain
MSFSNPRLAPASIGLLLGLLLVAGCAHAGAAGRPAAAPARPASASTAPPALDPSEEITPQELASIPEPLGDSVQPSIAPGKAPAEASEPRSQAPEAAKAAEPPPLPKPAPPGEFTWRVQILATPDRAYAERVAKEAVERLGTTSRIDQESGLYKVRLGGFAGEGDAQVLRQRALESGYPGAFRIKMRTRTTDE